MVGRYWLFEARTPAAPALANAWACATAGAAAGASASSPESLSAGGAGSSVVGGSASTESLAATRRPHGPGTRGLADRLGVAALRAAAAAREHVERGHEAGAICVHRARRVESRSRSRGAERRLIAPAGAGNEEQTGQVRADGHTPRGGGVAHRALRAGHTRTVGQRTCDHGLERQAGPERGRVRLLSPARPGKPRA